MNIPSQLHYEGQRCIRTTLSSANEDAGSSSCLVAEVGARVGGSGKRMPNHISNQSHVYIHQALHPCILGYGQHVRGKVFMRISLVQF